jgi:hypothetical protein
VPFLEQWVLDRVTDERIVQLFSGAARRIEMLAPGISVRGAGALSEAWRRLGPSSVAVAFDVDPEVVRLGYGSFAGLALVHQTATELGQEVGIVSGVRIARLTVDDTTLVFNPLATAIGEACPECSNAFRLETGLADSAPGPQLDLGLLRHASSEATEDAVGPEHLEELKKQLAADPPPDLALARRVRLFHSRIEFVELELVNCYLSRQRAEIPKDLLQVVHDDRLRDRLRATFDLLSNVELVVGSGDKKLTEDSLRLRRKQLADDFLEPLKGYGNVMLKENKAAFEARAAILEAEVKSFRDGLTNQLQEELTRSARALAKELAPAVKRSPPPGCVKAYGPAPDGHSVEEWVEGRLAKAFGTARDLLKHATLKLVRKGVTPELVRDPEFVRRLKEAFP